MEHNDLKSSITALNHNVELIALRMEEGFKRMDERFEVIDKRFEDSNNRFESMERHFDKRFSKMFSFITIGFVVMATMMSVFQFLG